MWRSEIMTAQLVTYRAPKKKAKIIPDNFIETSIVLKIESTGGCSKQPIPSKTSLTSEKYQIWSKSGKPWSADALQNKSLAYVYSYANELGEHLKGNAILFTGDRTILYLYRNIFTAPAIYIETNPGEGLSQGFRLTTPITTPLWSPSPGGGSSSGSTFHLDLPHTIKYEHQPSSYLTVSSKLTDDELSKISEDDLDPIMFTELKGEEVLKMNCCKQVLLQDTVISFMTTQTSCPLCKSLFTSGTGPQPSGTMTIIEKKFACDGHAPGTFEIIYNFSSGTRNGNHYSGDTRRNYIPMDDYGNQILKILISCFEKGYLYTIGSSASTGADNVIKFNIHQKTRTNGGETAHGWPDSTYLDRLKSECASVVPNAEGCLL